ncbi:MAG: LamG-like jellyroll fold domain-containing protein [Bacteroidota bacterium]
MEDITAIQREVEQLIAQGKTAKAFEVLSRFQLTETDKELIVLNGQYNRIQDEKRLDIISNEEAQRKINQINLALLNLSEKLGQPKKPAGIAGKAPSGNRWWLLLLIPVLAIAGFFLTRNSDEPVAEKEKLEEPDTDKVSEQQAPPAESAPVEEEEAEAEPTYLNPLEHKFLLAFFPFDGNVDSHNERFIHQESTVLYDYHDGHDGVQYSSVYFDGTVGGIVFDQLFLPQNQPHYAYSFWVKPSKTAQKRQAIVGQFGNAKGKYVSTNHYAAIENSKNAVFVDEYPPSTIKELQDDYGEITFDEWNHVVIVVNGSKELVYINNKAANIGDLKNAEQFSLRGMTQFNKPTITVIGGRPKLTAEGEQVYGDESMSGELDDLFIFKGVIDEATVEALYHFRYHDNQG